MGSSASVLGSPESPHELVDNDVKHLERKNYEEICDILNFDSSNNVDNFTREIIMSCPHHPSLLKMLNDESGRHAFVNFLKSEFAEENIMYYEAIEAMKTKSPKDVATEAAALREKYTIPENRTIPDLEDTLGKKISEELNNETSSHSENVLHAISSVQKDIVSLMALEAFPRFLISKSYADYLPKTADITSETATDNENGHIETDKVSSEDGQTSSSWLKMLIEKV
jgi:hypothetical protein